MAYLSVREIEGVRLVSADRPPANAMDIGFLDELAQTLERVAGEPPGAVVLAGREGFFSAGADLNALAGYDAQERRAMVTGINRMVLAAYGIPCPLVAAVTGHAIAGGLILALCADLRVAATRGRYGLTEVAVGVPYPQAAIAVVKSELSPAVGRRLALGAQLTDAADCLRSGVFDEVLEPDAVIHRALELASAMAAFPAAVYVATKRQLRGAALCAMGEAAANDPLLLAPQGAT